MCAVHRLLSDPYFSVKRLFFHMHDVMHYKSVEFKEFNGVLPKCIGLLATAVRRSN